MAGQLSKTLKPWVRPWNLEKFDNLFNRDERYFSILLKGALSWFNENMMMYNKPINHFIFTTGSSYMYIESNGYDFKWNETTGEDWMYMQLPRCVVELGSLRIPTEELTSPYSRGTYERMNGDVIQSFNAQIRRLPVELELTFRYYFSNFNECLIFLQEAMDKLLFQKFFRIAYLGETIRCSIEPPQDFNIQISPIDMTSSDPRQRTIELSMKINSNYPLIDENTEIPTDRIITSFSTGTNFSEWSKSHPIFLFDNNHNKVKIHYNENDEFVDENDNVIDELYDEFGELLTKKEIFKLFNFSGIPLESTIFNGTVDNTSDKVESKIVD